MSKKFGWASRSMFSFKTKEATYDATVVAGASNFFSTADEEVKAEWPDIVSDDGDMVTGYEFPTTQEIMENDVRITITAKKAHPTILAAAIAMAMGSSTPAKDGAYSGYRHKGVLMAATGTLPSINAVLDFGGSGGGQWLFKGLFAESLKISGAKGEYLQFELVLRGSGTRATNADSFVAAISDSWLKVRNIRSWLESGANISIAATPTQGSQNISSDTPDALASLFKSFEFSLNNNPEKQLDNIGVDLGKRMLECKVTLDHEDTTRIDYYSNQDNLAFEINLDSGSLVDPSGAYKYGMILLIASAQLKSAPLPAPGVQRLSADHVFTVKNDGSNEPIQIYTYNALAAYLA